LQAKSAGLEERVLTDVAPFTLGVEVAERGANNVLLHGLFLPVIERNTIIPASRSHVLETIADNQTELNLKVYQGESRFVQDNVLLGQLNMSVPRGPAGQEKVDVRFSYDTSGLLEVDVTVLSQSLHGGLNRPRHQRLTIRGNAGALTDEEIQVRSAALQKLKIHPRDEALNLALIERGKRLYEENLGGVRDVIGSALAGFMAILEKQEPHEIEATRKQFAELLDGFDRSVLT
jgi:molecular chaperone HscC